MLNKLDEREVADVAAAIRQKHANVAHVATAAVAFTRELHTRIMRTCCLAVELLAKLVEYVDEFECPDQAVVGFLGLCETG